MIRISALNEDSNDSTDEDAVVEISTKEAQEEAAFALYNKALQLQNDGFLDDAEVVFKELLSSKVLEGVRRQRENKPLDRTSTASQSLLLKYSAYKNLGNIASSRGDFELSIECYLEAVFLDASDVTIWHRIGVNALKIYNYPLAKLAFLEGLRCNPNHWPCLDHVVTILYVLNNYTSCLYYISQALKKDSLYAKGLAFRNQIFREHPGLRRETEDLFSECDSSIYSTSYTKEEQTKFIEEALHMREVRRALCEPEKQPVLEFTKPLTSKTFKGVGECLVDLYDFISNADKPILFSCHVNVDKYVVDREPEKESTGSIASSSRSDSVIEEQVVSENSAPAMSLGQDCVNIEPSSTQSQAVADIGGQLDVDEGQSLLQTDSISESSSANSRKSKKRKNFFLECLDAASKRRSARVRNTVIKKQPEYVNYSKLLETFLPSSLLSNDGENQPGLEPGSSVNVDKSVGDKSQYTENRECETSQRKLEEGESTEVQQFLESVCANIGVLDIMYKYAICLGKKDALIWPGGLSSIYLQVYERLRKHITHPSVLSMDFDEEDFCNEGYMTLNYCEFKVEHWLLANCNNQGNPSPSPTFLFRIPSPSPLSVDFSSPRFIEDTNYLMQLMANKHLFGSNSLQFSVRVCLLKGRFLILQNQRDFAVDCLQRIIELFSAEFKENKVQNPCVKIHNCKVDNIVTIDNIQKQLESLQQCQSLEELHRLYEAGEYKKAVDLLLPTIVKPQSAAKLSNCNNIPERHSQLLLLQDSLWHLEDMEQCLRWGEASFHEALQHYVSASSKDPSRKEWANTMTQLLSNLELCISKDATVIHSLAPVSLKRFIKNLIQVIVIQMETSLSDTDVTLKTVLPWILLFQAIRQEEAKIRSLLAKSFLAERKADASQHENSDAKDCNSLDMEFGPGMPSSLMLLYNAHEHLGRRGWCCQSDGALLLLYVKVLMCELNKSSSANSSHPFKEDFEASIEQCFYCLYGHPNRKAKARHLQEHNAPQISLNWERALSLFEYFKPKELPEFDGYKITAISIEVEHLLRRILTLIPPVLDPGSRVELMSAFVEGSVPKIPRFSEELSNNQIVSELYYLLADYYFKNNEQGKAIKFYLFDVCVKPSRFNSWAGMALARSSQLEQKLNSCDLRFDGPIYRRATGALRCYNQAHELDPSVPSLWVENGSLAYMVHSYVCRQLKQRTQFDLSNDLILLLRSKRREMLRISQQCYKSANQCEEGADEEWLHHYMLGKIAEKLNKPPQEYLAHYKMAALHLHLEGAAYPNKIQYHQPPHLAIEALEVYYRTHASVLKFLIRHEGQPLEKDVADQIEKFLSDIREEPFARFQEKRQETSDAESGVLLLTEQHKKLRKVSPLANDHDYFRRKRKSTSNEDLSAEPRQPSADSSSESQDSVAVKDLLNSLVCVISERQQPASSTDRIVPTIIVGDTKVHRPSSQNEGSVTREEVITESGVQGPDVPRVEVVGDVSTAPSLTCEDVRKEKESFTDASTKNTPDATTTTIKKDSNESGVCDHRHLVKKCELALKECLQRFPQHYKSVYRLAHYYTKSKFHRNLQWSLDYLIGPKSSWQQHTHMVSPALFAERKNSNFFNGNWRIPIDEIDRPGSFATHMFRSVLLTISVLELSGEHSLLIQITVQLHRNPDTGKKYLRDVDRLFLATVSYERCIRTILRKMKMLCRDDDDPRKSPRAVRHMLDTYRAWQTLQKVVSNPEVVNGLLEKCYDIFKKGKLNEPLPCFDQAIRYCQHQLVLSKYPVDDGLSGNIALRPVPESKASSSAHEPMGMTVSKAKSLLRTSGNGNQHSSDNRSNLIAVCRPSTTANQMKFVSYGHVLNSPNLLTVDVQSKIKSLDPIEPYRMFASRQMSGFQMEFLRQITANACPPPPPPPVPQSNQDTNPRLPLKASIKRFAAANSFFSARQLSKSSAHTQLSKSSAHTLPTVNRNVLPEAVGVKRCFVHLKDLNHPRCDKEHKS